MTGGLVTEVLHTLLRSKEYSLFVCLLLSSPLFVAACK